MLYRLILSFTFIVTALFSANGQSFAEREAMLHCRDGSIYKGYIIEEDHQFIHLLILTSDTILVPKYSIKRVKRGTDHLFHSSGKTHDTNGFFWAVSLGFNGAGLFGTSTDDASSHMQVLFGWRMNKRWSFATCLGTEFNTSEVAGFYLETQFTSLSIYGRYYITDNRQRLFAYSRVGYGFVPEGNFESLNHSGGVQAQAGFGIHFASRKKSRFVLSLGYYMQDVSGNQRYLDTFNNEILVDFDFLIHRPILKFGVEFH